MTGRVAPVSLQADDAVELSQLLAFLSNWMDADRAVARSLIRFVGCPSYDAAALQADVRRFAFLLGGGDPRLALGLDEQQTGAGRVVRRSPAVPSGDDTATIACPVCGRRYEPSGRRRYCSDSCRRLAWRRRHQTPVAAIIAPPAGRPRRPITVYECGSCDTRSLGEQRCPDCTVFMHRVGFGGLCPCCDEPVAAAELTEP